MLIALDAMGGDHAPGPIVAGAVEAVQTNPGLSVLLVGDQAQIEACLALMGGSRERITILHCSQVVSMEDKPVEAMRRKPDNSIKRCWERLALSEVDGIVSAGNTGAMVAGAFFVMRRFLKNVRRPGIAAVLPTLRGKTVILDVGANVSPIPEDLYQYGVMGSIFAKHILQSPQPMIGLMNVGSEEGKGHDLAKDTHALFNNSSLKEQFVGNVEGRDICRGLADVVVCDGFTGNVVLKTSEGVFEFVMKKAAEEILGSLSAERDKGQQAIQRLVDRYDYSESGGAPLLGIDGVCIICHGSSGAKAIKNALGMAARFAGSHLNQLIVQALETNPGTPAGA